MNYSAETFLRVLRAKRYRGAIEGIQAFIDGLVAYVEWTEVQAMPIEQIRAELIAAGTDPDKLIADFRAKFAELLSERDSDG